MTKDDDHDLPEQPDDATPAPDNDSSIEELAQTIDTSRAGDSEALAELNEAIDAAPIRQPDQIGTYTIVRVLGEGGMGVTYEAVQAVPKRRVAVKVIRGSRFTENARKRFEYEAQVLARMQHPGIAQIYEAGMWTDEDGAERPFMAMEFVDGCSLSTYVDRHELSSDDLLRLFRKICEAVHYSHQRGVIHRDLKPDNIMIRKDGQPKVIDFGVARTTDSDLNYVTQQTNMGQLIGTLQYMSPEQVEYDTTDLDTRSDVYALGVILYELLCGRPPYDLKARALHEAVRVICEDQPEHPSTFHRYLRGDVETITLKALEKNRNRRYGSVEDFSADIRRYLEDDPIEARPPSVIYRLSKFTRKHRVTSISAATVVLAITAGGIVSAMGWAEAARQRDRVEVRNDQLGGTVNELLSGVMGQVQHLGNSADAQRALLALAAENVEVIAAEAGDETAYNTYQQALLLMRLGKSHLSSSGVGFGSLDESVAAFDQANTLLDGIDLSTVDAQMLPEALTLEAFNYRVSAMRLDCIKYRGEIEYVRALLFVDESARLAALRASAEHYRNRTTAARAYGDGGGSETKMIDVLMSSQLGLGNVLFWMQDLDGARTAYTTALNHAKTLESIDGEGKKRVRRMRDRAVAMHGLAKVDWEIDPDTAMAHLVPSVDLFRAIVLMEPDKVRRPRDLAITLALRAKIHSNNARDVDAAVTDYIECVDMFTTRAVKSPRESRTQQDLESNLMQMAEMLGAVGRSAKARAIISGTVTQLHCVAEAENRAGNTEWTEILIRLEGLAQDQALAAPNP
jgi:serine/threonine protein kinase